MELSEAIANPKINAFDIIPDKRSSYGFQVHTYKKPGETDDEFYERDNRNFQKAFQLKNKK